MITQNTKCVSDLYVSEFVKIHAMSRNISDANILDKVVDMANKFTGEMITGAVKVTELSGGQTRALLFADAILIGASPIILVDEIENAGINKSEILKYVHNQDKLVIFATHDPGIVLQTEKRILMKNGAIAEVTSHSDKEREVLKMVTRADEVIREIQQRIRDGESLDADSIKEAIQ